MKRESKGGSNTLLAVIVGGLVVAVAGLGYFSFAGSGGSVPNEVNVTIETIEPPASE